MTELKIFIPEELKRKMEEYNVNWSNIIEEFIIKEIEELNKLKAIVSKSVLTERDALEFSKSVDESLSNKFKELASNK
ncbi:MAG TPA: hypothetical protein VMV49_09595 [Candidatus Deferrimicrobium sp.]|nr:hypothetical protein [Candidatus Deferrimicrobium sp.]